MFRGIKTHTSDVYFADGRGISSGKPERKVLSTPICFIFQALVCTFQALVCTFQALVCTFQALVYTYQSLEYKNSLRAMICLVLGNGLWAVGEDNVIVACRKKKTYLCNVLYI